MSELTNDERDLLDRLLKQAQPSTPAAPAPRQRAPQRPRPKPRTIQPAVKVEPIASPGPATANTRTTILNRRALDVSLPTAKGVASFLGWVNSAVTSGAMGWQIQNIAWVYHHPGQSIELAPTPWNGLTVALAVQLLATFGQVYTAGRTTLGYLICLAPDALTTAYQWARWLIYPWLIALVSLVAPDNAQWITTIMSSIMGLVIGYFSARWPEDWMFGARKKGR
jgi:hypothetical protein